MMKIFNKLRRYFLLSSVVFFFIAPLFSQNSGLDFDGSNDYVTISNSSDAPYTLRNQSKYDFYNLTNLVIVPAHGEVNIDVRTIKKTRKFELEFEVLSALTAPQTHPVINIIIRVNQ